MAVPVESFVFSSPAAVHSAGAVADAAGLELPMDTGVLSVSAGVVLAMGAAIGLLRRSRSEGGWRKEASGERQAGRALEGLRPRGVQVLHDRGVPKRVGGVVISTPGPLRKGLLGSSVVTHPPDRAAEIASTLDAPLP